MSTSKNSRINHKKNFTIVSNHILENPNLSWQAKGLYGYLVSRPKDWTFNCSDLINRATNGRDSLNRAKKELKEAGHLIIEPVRHGGGKFSGYTWTLIDVPPISNHGKPEMREAGNVENQNFGKPEFRKTQSLNNTNLTNTNCSNTNLTNTEGIKEKSKRKVDVVETGLIGQEDLTDPPRGQLPPLSTCVENEKEGRQEKEKKPRKKKELLFTQKLFYEIVWPATYRKTNKKAALKAFMGLNNSNTLTGWISTPESLKKVMSKWIEQNNQWIADQADKEFIPHPATWFNGERWEDEIVKGKPDPVYKSNSYKKHEANILAYQKMKNDLRNGEF